MTIVFGGLCWGPPTDGNYQAYWAFCGKVWSLGAHVWDLTVGGPGALGKSFSEGLSPYV